MRRYHSVRGLCGGGSAARASALDHSYSGSGNVSKVQVCDAPVSTERMCATGSPLELLQPETLRWKVMEPVNLLGKEKFSAVDIRLRVKGGGHVSQAYGVAYSALCQGFGLSACRF